MLTLTPKALPSASTSACPPHSAVLSTLRTCSATLFQLISDVLDVSKIEAGQMTLEHQDFCPLELTEDSVRTYSAFAQAKGLQLYARPNPAPAWLVASLT